MRAKSPAACASASLGAEPIWHTLPARLTALHGSPVVQVALRLYGVPEAAAAAVCTFPDMKVGLLQHWLRRAGELRAGFSKTELSNAPVVLQQSLPILATTHPAALGCHAERG